VPLVGWGSPNEVPLIDPTIGVSDARPVRRRGEIGAVIMGIRKPVRLACLLAAVAVTVTACSTFGAGSTGGSGASAAPRTPTSAAASASLPPDWDNHRSLIITLPADPDLASLIRLGGAKGPVDMTNADLVYHRSAVDGVPELAARKGSGITLSMDWTNASMSPDECERLLLKSPEVKPIRNLRLGSLVCVGLVHPTAVAILGLTQTPDKSGTLHMLEFFHAQSKVVSATPSQP
jgi:hypothetical protein